MFQGFLTALLGLLPFLKELVLGNQTLRQAIMNNKFVVALGLVFLMLFSSTLYMRDAAKAADDRAHSLELQLAAKVCPPPTTTPPVVITEPAPATSTPDPKLAEKDATIEALKQRVARLEQQHEPQPTKHHSKPTHTSDSNAELDRLYQHTGRP